MKNFYRLIQGDCLKMLPTFDDESVDLIFTDPPYEAKTKKVIGDVEGIDWNVLSKELSRILKSDGSLLMFCPIVNLPKFIKIGEGVRPFRWQIIEYVCNRMQSISNFYLQYNPILWFSNHTIKPQKRVQDLFRTTIIPNAIHPAQKNLETCKFIVDNFSRVNGIFLDPLMGSGTVMEACQDLRRNCIGIEIDANNCESIRTRCFGRQFLDREVSYSFEVFGG